MGRFTIGLSFLLLSGCNSPELAPASSTTCEAPFLGLATSDATPEDQQILREASEDFCAVVSGKNPIHAKFDTSAALPSDGGTTFYIGRKYRLTVLRSISTFGSFDGEARGPIITFDKPFAAGNTTEISNIRVYPGPPSPRMGSNNSFKPKPLRGSA